MKHILTEEQKKEFLNRICVVYKNFKVINTGGWTAEEAYKMGIVDFCDSLISASSEITYDISSLRSDVEYLFGEIDSKVN